MTKKGYELPDVKIITSKDFVLTLNESLETGIKVDDDFWTLDLIVNDSVEGEGF